MSRFINLAGQKFGSWSVLEQARPGLPIKWLCVCDCGISRSVLAGSLRSGVSTNCGCQRRIKIAARNLKHGASKRRAETPEYRCWKHMVERCTNAKSHDFRYYGGRGIRVIY